MRLQGAVGVGLDRGLVIDQVKTESDPIWPKLLVSRSDESWHVHMHDRISWYTVSRPLTQHHWVMIGRYDGLVLTCLSCSVGPPPGPPTGSVHSAAAARL